MDAPDFVWWDVSSGNASVAAPHLPSAKASRQLPTLEKLFV